jgi:hypothetical protein
MRVHPSWQGGEWHCRNCSPDDRWHSVYDYVMKRDGLTFVEAKELIDGPGSTKAKAPEDPQQYPAKHGCSWADYATWNAAMVPWIDYRKDKNGQSLPTTGQTFDAILFLDATGGRYRIFNHPDLKFIPVNTNQAPVLYGLPEAVLLANQTGQQMLYLVNGQPSVIACHAHGIPAFTIPGGEGNIAGFLRKGLLQHLMVHWTGPIRVCFDGDKQGYKSAPGVVDVLLGAGYNDVQALDLGQGNDAADVCVLNNGTSVQAFQGLPIFYPLPPPPTPPAGSTSAPAVPLSNRYQVDVTRRDMIALVGPAWDAVVACNNPPSLFRRDKVLVQLVVVDGVAHLEPVNQTRLRGIVARSCVFIEQKHYGPVPWLKPDAALLDDMLLTIDPRILPIDRIVQVPVFAPDGTLLDTPGYHAKARLYYHPRAGLVIPAVPATPTQAEAAKAKALICDDLLIDFPFVAEADRAHAIALMLLPYVRELIAGPTPLHLIEAPVPGSGKNLLVTALLAAIAGESKAIMTEAGDDDEWRKKLTAALVSAPEAIVLDNLNRALDSASLASILTTPRWTDRLLGSSTNISVPVRCVWVATANNPFMSGEIARRSIRIRIDPRTDQPQTRVGFKHQPLDEWVHEHAGEIIAACLTLIRYGLTHGSPPLKTLGSFEWWASTMGLILDGIAVPSFLGNLQDLYDRADAEGAAWRDLVASWWATYGDTEIGVSQIFTLLDDDSDLPIRGKDEAGRRASFGKLLKRKRDSVVGNFQITCAGSSLNTVRWRLLPIKNQP